jgi:hypothetical protein
VALAEAVVFEFETEDRLDVFGFYGRDDGAGDNACVEGGGAEVDEALTVAFECVVLFCVFDVFFEDV